MQEIGDRHKIRDQRLTGICSRPEHRLVLVTIAVSIFHSGLRLANASQASDGLRLGHRHRSVGKQGCVDALDDVLAPGEERIAPVRNIPEPWC